MSDNALMIQSKGELSIEDMKSQVAKVQDLMKSIMKDGEHYGIIPGTNKPSLYKAGAEKLGFVFRLRPEFDIVRSFLDGDHREYEIICKLMHMGTGAEISQGVGNCSTMESKYRYRQAQRTCPACGQETIIKGKEEYGGGWLCFKKKGGCGMKYPDDSALIIDQKLGQVENPDIADTFNTVKKMAKKRAHIDAIITACAASDIFTQDVEDFKQTTETKTSEPEEEHRYTTEELAAESLRGAKKLHKLKAADDMEYAQMVDMIDKGIRKDIAKLMKDLAKRIPAAEKEATAIDAGAPVTGVVTDDKDAGLL